MHDEGGLQYQFQGLYANGNSGSRGVRGKGKRTLTQASKGKKKAQGKKRRKGKTTVGIKE